MLMTMEAGSKKKSKQHKSAGKHDNAEADIREDEEQSVKLAQIIDLLLAAGYFRARIKGLEAFDKVVGGMVWCMTTCYVDVDVDLLFQENSTIGQKIALTEKIMAVLPRMECPHSIEPHQIQGLDAIHIYPIVQWLVKRAVATREETGDYVRQYAISQFNKHYTLPQDVTSRAAQCKMAASLRGLHAAHPPQRMLRRHDAMTLRDEATRVQSTLIEFGDHRSVAAAPSAASEDRAVASKKAVVEAKAGVSEEEEEERRREERILQIKSGMTAVGTRVAASAVGSVLAQQRGTIQRMASEYADKSAELGEVTEGWGAGQSSHQRHVAKLNKQLEAKRAALAEATARHASLHAEHDAAMAHLDVTSQRARAVEERLVELRGAQAGHSETQIEELCRLMATNEQLKQQELDFRSNCKAKMVQLQAEIEQLQRGDGADESAEAASEANRQLEAASARLAKTRLVLARKTRETAALERRMDEVPSRAELTQYQRRFIELYHQIASKHKETKQFYTLYNTLDDTKVYLAKEVSLLESIHDSFAAAMAGGAGSRDQFLAQLDTIVDGVKRTKQKLSGRYDEVQLQRSQLSDQLQSLLDKQRVYYKTVKDFMEECRRNEILQARLSA